MRLIANIPNGKEKEYKRLCKLSRKQVLKMQKMLDEVLSSTPNTPNDKFITSVQLSTLFTGEFELRVTMSFPPNHLIDEWNKQIPANKKIDYDKLWEEFKKDLEKE